MLFFGGHVLKAKERIKYFLEKESKNSFVQSQKKWFNDNGYSDLIYLLDDDLRKTKMNLFEFAYGKAICKGCHKEHTRLLNKHGWRGWAATCSDTCEITWASERQKGKNNTSHRMTEKTKESMKNKLSSIMKKKILSGDFTPKTENYKTFGMIEFKIDEKIKKVRSLWELLYWLENDNLEYEKIRIEYFDELTNKNKIYITDFFNSDKNEIIEIKPKKYQDIRFENKKKACEKQGFLFTVIDESYFNKFKNDVNIISKIESCVINSEKIKGRLKWLKRA